MPEILIDRFPLDPDVVRGLDLDEALSDELQGRLRETLDSARGSFEEGKGIAVLTGLEGEDGESLRSAFTRVCSAFGDLMAQDGDGTLIREVKDRGAALGEGQGTRYADTRTGGDFHTDGAEAPLPVPASFALQCVRPAQSGGELVLIPLPRILEQLDPETEEVLRRPFHFDRRGDERDGGDPTTLKPILFEDETGRTSVTYLRRYIEVAHARTEIPDLTKSQVDALDAFDELLEDPDLTVHDRLAGGELALIDNLHTLHGRTEFVDFPDPSRSRLLYRAWISEVWA
jgi:alpha-ketoglutarate-dependent taurine dioxygenase